MNLSAYDIVKGINRNGTWIDPKYKRLYSRELPVREYFGFSKTFNPQTNSYDFYLILSDTNPNDGSFVRVIDKYRPLKIPLIRIWNDISIYITEVTNITVSPIENNNDYDIYLINL